MIQGTIESLAFGGEGILRHNGLVIFVPFTAPGDVVEVEIQTKKKNFAHGKLLRLIQPAKMRTEPRCPYFGSCGGCQFQHIDYPHQVESKRTFILDALKRIGKIDYDDVTVLPAKEQWQYRRHIRLNLRNEGEGFKAGYIGCNPSEFIAVTQCPIFIPKEDALLKDLRPLLIALSNKEIEKGSLRIIKTDSEKFILALTFSPALPGNADEIGTALNTLTNLQGIVMQSPSGKKIFGDIRCETEILGLKARFSPFGFLQNHPQQSAHLYLAIRQALSVNSSKILDLYCGIGITSLLIATQKKVWGVESHAETLQLAKENASLNNITSVEFCEGKAESLGVELLKSKRPDTVICNPPRLGIDPVLLQALINEKPANILYVSCMPSTLARDLQKLIQSGYRIERIQGFDMFPQTTHVETLVKLIL